MSQGQPGDKRQENLPGDCIELLAMLFIRNRIRTFRYFVADYVPPIQDVVPQSKDRQRVLDDAVALRTRTGIPFIDALMLEMLRHGPDRPLLAALGRHFRYPLFDHTLDGPPISALRDLSSQPLGDRILVLASEVVLDDRSVMHIPMLDFRFSPSPANQRLIVAILGALRILPGYLLESGNSYHFYGVRLMTAEEIRNLLSRALIYGPVVDKTWAAHQLLDGFCGLRISPRPPFGLPRVVSFLPVEQHDIE